MKQENEIIPVINRNFRGLTKGGSMSVLASQRHRSTGPAVSLLVSDPAAKPAR
jgi:hypothetical protein